MLLISQLHSSKVKIILIIRVFPDMSSLYITEYCVDNIWCSQIFVHDFGMSRPAEDAREWELPYISTAVLLSELEQGTVLYKRYCACCGESIRSVLSNHTALTWDASASAEHTYIVPLLSGSERPSSAWTRQICCTHEIQLCTFISVWHVLSSCTWGAKATYLK